MLAAAHFCFFFLFKHVAHRDLLSFPTRRSSDLASLVFASTTFSFFGAALGLLIMDLEFSITSVLGLVSLIGDRKSTRLNSSHVAISYAVFCLKKKTKNINQTTKMMYAVKPHI